MVQRRKLKLGIHIEIRYGRAAAQNGLHLVVSKCGLWDLFWARVIGFATLLQRVMVIQILKEL